jgi:hypothetical protein
MKTAVYWRCEYMLPIAVRYRNVTKYIVFN